jgi:Putative polyhydroxyalkanoic acid system protein (PHA_gran_rgn)
MRITISHNRPKAEIVEAVDRSFGDLFKTAAQLPVKITVQERTWQGSTLNFALTAKWGLLSTPVKGTVEVTDHDITVDADLGLLNRFISENTAHSVLTDRVKGLLK